MIITGTNKKITEPKQSRETWTKGNRTDF